MIIKGFCLADPLRRAGCVAYFCVGLCLSFILLNLEMRKNRRKFGRFFFAYYIKVPPASRPPPGKKKPVVLFLG